MTFLGELRLEARIESLRTISHFVAAIAERLQLTEKIAFEIELAVDEAATNIVRHAYPEGQSGDLLLHVDVLHDVLRINLTDWGEPLNPANVRPFDADAPVEARIQGGMGLYLIHNLMDGVSRASNSADGSNTLTLIRNIERRTPGTQASSSQRELNAMLSVTEFMSLSIDLDNLLRRIVDELVDTINADRGTLYLVDHEHGQLVSRVVHADTGALQEIRLRLGQGVAGWVAESGRVLNIREARADARFNPEVDEATGYRTQTILAAPMRNQRREIIGVVQLINKRGGYFSVRDERLLTAMTSQAAISIENASLYEQQLQQQLVQRELETARAIQKSFLPSVIPQHDGWDMAAFWHPMREVAGDFYDFVSLPDGRLAVVIADVSGKGIPAALFMALSVTVLRFAMRLDLTADELLRQANEAIISAQQSRMFVTTAVAYVDLASGAVELASAGHNPPLVWRATGSTFVEVEGVAMGLFPGATFERQRLLLKDGDILVLYTDGITEIVNDDEEEFDETRLQAVVAAHADRPAAEIVERIVEAAAAFGGDAAVFDDQTLVVVRRV